MKEKDIERKIKILKSSIPELPNRQSGSYKLKINPIFLRPGIVIFIIWPQSTFPILS